MPCIMVINLGLLHLTVTHSTMQQCLYCKCSTDIQSCKTAQGVHFTACHALLHLAVAVHHVALPAIVEAKQGPYYKLSEEHFHHVMMHCCTPRVMRCQMSRTLSSGACNAQ